MSTLIDNLHEIAKMLPEVKRPASPPSTKERLLWTGIALVIFFAMYHVTAFGLKQPSGETDFIQTITASRLGSLITIGIGPIVLASIFLQLFVGAGIININLYDRREREKFHEAQKVLAIVLAIIEGSIFVLGSVGGIGLSERVFSILGWFTVPFVIFQVVLGSIFLLYLDEVVTKYGLGSGISLFIAAGVSLSIVGGFISLSYKAAAVLAGGTADAIPNAILTLLPFIFTVIVFLVVVYGESIKVEIPIAFERIRGFAPKLPLRFFYVSNIPVIFASALLVNVSMLSHSLLSQPLVDGSYQLAHQIGAVLYLITPIYYDVAAREAGTIGHIEFLIKDVTPVFGIPQYIHALIYIISLMLMSIIFGIFWVETANMDAKSVANQLCEAGFQIPGFRKDARMLENILNKYIFPLTVLGSLSVGLLAGLADLTGALGTGTGILLTVGILYRTYEQMEQHKMLEAYPALSKFLGAE
jgi:preprotein translocase subunit SecY